MNSGDVSGSKIEHERFTGLSDLTLVILSYDRPRYLARQIEYWSDTDVNLCIFDGSIEATRLDLQNYNGLNARYYHSPTGFNDRLVLAVGHVSTKYVAMLCDDEFYLKHGLADCLKILDEDSNLIGCFGRALYFFVSESKVHGHEVYEKAQNLPNNFGDGLKRVASAFPGGDPSRAPNLVFGVFRRDPWSKMFATAYGATYSSGYVYELAVLIIGFYLGPTLVVDSLVWLRSGENSPVISDDAMNRKLGSGEWGTSLEFCAEREEFIKRLCDCLAESGRHSREAIELSIRDLFSKNVTYAAHKPKRLRAKWNKKVYFVARHMPNFIKSTIKKNLPRNLGPLLDYRAKPLMMALERFQSKGVRFNWTEIEQIEAMLISFHHQSD